MQKEGVAPRNYAEPRTRQQLGVSGDSLQKQLITRSTQEESEEQPEPGLDRYETDTVSFEGLVGPW
jgi:hypothetical protein